MSQLDKTSLCMVILSFIAMTSAANAAVVTTMTVDDLAIEADRIVLGTIADVDSRWNADGTLIVSDVQLRTNTTLKGKVRGEATLQVVGGTVDDLSLRTTDMPVFQIGDAVLVFLDAQDRLVGSFQGVFYTDGELVARAEPAVHGIDQSQIMMLRDVADDISAALGVAEFTDDDLRVSNTAALPNNGRFVPLGFDWSYQAQPMGEQYFINPNGADASSGPVQNQIAAIFLGATVWSDAGGNFEFDLGGTTTSTTDGFDGINNIFFCPAGNCGMAPTTLATTRIWFTGSNILEWDIIFNDAGHNFWDGQTGSCSGVMYDIQAIAAHEFGHALGLGHSLNSSATMWLSIPPCVTSPRVLDQDDVDGLISLYGSSGGGGAPQVPFLFTGEDGGDRLGFAVAGAGDVDNDGTEDLIVGAPYNDENGTNAGKVYVYSGATGTLIYAIAGAGTNYRFGWSVDGAGDVNGDGWDDVIIGAPYASGLRGRVYVYSGRNGLLMYRKNGRSGSTERYGWSVAGGFDVDADGVSDFIIGAPFANDTGNQAGRVHVFSGANGNLIKRFLGENSGDRFGWDVDGLGRINSDQYDDFIIGAPYNDDAGNKAGKAYIFSGRHLSTLYTITGVQTRARFGTVVAGLGFVDSDNRSDFVVASPYYKRGSKSDAGRIDMYSGRYGDRLFSKKGQTAGDRLGWSVAPAGDVDGDGSADVVIGAPRHSTAGNKAGRVYIRSGVTGATILILDGDAAGDQLGYAVGSIADTDADGTPELLLGAPFNDLSAGKAGRAYANFSNARAVGRATTEDETDEPRATQTLSVRAARQLTNLLRAWMRDELLADVDGNDIVDDLDLELILTGRAVH